MSWQLLAVAIQLHLLIGKRADERVHVARNGAAIERKSDERVIWRVRMSPWRRHQRLIRRSLAAAVNYYICDFGGVRKDLLCELRIVRELHYEDTRN